MGDFNQSIGDDGNYGGGDEGYDDDDRGEYHDALTVRHNFLSTALADNRVGDAGAEADPASLSAEAGKRTRPCQFPA